MSVRDGLNWHSGVVHGEDDVTHFYRVSIKSVENRELTQGCGESENSLSGAIDRREFFVSVHLADGELADSGITSKCSHETVCNKIDLEFTIFLTTHEIADANNFSVEIIMSDMCENEFFCAEF